MSKKIHVRLTVNGTVVEAEVEPRLLLADFLRHQLALKGTHVGCEHGVCGACTVLVDGASARSCLLFAAQLEGASITTVEGLAHEREARLIRDAFHENHALQCGFCTPGFLATVHEFLANAATPSDKEIRETLSGNICRCTGYVNIVKAVRAAAERLVASRREAAGRP
jgi:carbon-monoxide dehydrogenase small subunit